MAFLQAELGHAMAYHKHNTEFSEAEQIRLRFVQNKEKFSKLEPKFRQPAHIQHVLIEAFRPKNANDIKVVCDHASEQARAVIRQDSLSSPRHDRFNRPVDALNLCEEEICAIQMYTQVRALQSWLPSKCWYNIYHIRPMYTTIIASNSSDTVDVAVCVEYKLGWVFFHVLSLGPIRLALPRVHP